MSQHRTPETLVKETLGVEPAAADREAVWRSIADRLAERDAPGRAPIRGLAARRRPRLPRLAAVGLTALTVALAAVALPPAGDDRRERTPLLATASAAEVLNATAGSAASALPAVERGQHLFVRTRLTVGIAGTGPLDTRSWTATDGSARIVSRDRTSVTVKSFRPGSPVAVTVDDGVVRRSGPPQLSPNWRYVVPGDEVVGLPGDRDALLAALRARAERAAALYRQPRPKGYHPRFDRTYDLWGRDLLVVETATLLLLEAPLSPAQRSALLSMLADAPAWYRPGSAAEPIRIRNLGPTEDGLGRDGIALRFVLELSPGELRVGSGGSFDLVLAPDAGRLLETRSYEHGAEAEPVRLTVVDQRVVERR